MRPTISTAGGDDGSTGLFGGERVSKASVRLHAYGTVDEMNAVLGLVLAEDIPEYLRTQLEQMQKDLFVLGSDLATPLSKEGVRITHDDVQRIEHWGQEIESGLPALTQFILPSGCRAAALLHQARTICRRAERWLVHLAEEEEINEHAKIYLNRLSDYLFLVARAVNKEAKAQETQWRM